MSKYAVVFQKFNEPGGRTVKVEAKSASAASRAAKAAMRKEGFKVGSGKRSSTNWNSVSVRRTNPRRAANPAPSSLLVFGGVAAALGVGYVVMKGRCEEGKGPEFICDLFPAPTGGYDPPPAGGANPPAGNNPPTYPAGGTYTPPAGGTTTPPVVTVPPSDPLVVALQNAARGDAFFVNGQANADHWAYYWNQMRDTPLTGAQFTAAFGPDRGPAAMTAAQFVAALRSVGVGLSGLTRSMLGALRPQFGLAGIVYHNFFGTMIPYATVDEVMQGIAQSWQYRRGNDTGYADATVQRQPGDCQDLVDVANSHCGLAPEACEGYDVGAIAAALCQDYGEWFASEFPLGFGDAYNYSPEVFAAKFPGASQADYWMGPHDNPWVADTPAPLPAPVYVAPPQASNPILTVQAPPAPTTGAVPSTPAANGGTGDRETASTDLLGSTFKIGDYDVPVWALGAAAVGAFLFMQRKG